MHPRSFPRALSEGVIVALGPLCVSCSVSKSSHIPPVGVPDTVIPAHWSGDAGAYANLSGEWTIRAGASSVDSRQHQTIRR
jgi:hypothetical protein